MTVDTFFIGTLKGVGKVYLQAVMDCYNQHTLGRRYPSKQSVASVHMLNETTLSFFETHQAQVYTVLSNSGREFYGTMTIIPANSGGGIEHRRTKVRRPQSNGFIDRLHRTLLDEHFRIKGRTTWYESVGQMQTDLDSYLEHYNNL